MKIEQIAPLLDGRVVVIFNAQADNTGDLNDVKATGKRFTFREMHLMRFDEAGRLVENIVGGLNPLMYEIWQAPAMAPMLLGDAARRYAGPARSLRAMKLSIVIGHGPGGGDATTRAFAAQGHTVALIARNHAGTATASASIGKPAAAFAANAGDEAALTAAIDADQARFGAPGVIVYTAGAVATRPGPRQHAGRFRS